MCDCDMGQEKEEFANIIIPIDSMEISCDRNGIEAGIDEISAEFQAFPELYDCVCRIADDCACQRNGSDSKERDYSSY